MWKLKLNRDKQKDAHLCATKWSSGILKQQSVNKNTSRNFEILDALVLHKDFSLMWIVGILKFWIH